VPIVEAPTAVAEFERRPASSSDEHALVVPEEIQRDAAAIVDAALTEPQLAMLEFERQWWRQPGAKEQAIRDTFGVTPTRYYQNLNALLELPAALTYDAALVHRLLRLRGAATRGRRLV
jgi:Protein of unknown function (DUF3263)